MNIVISKVVYPQEMETQNPVRLHAFALLALANLLWAGNWVIGRALREVDPVTLNFFRWLVAVLALAPFALPRLRGKGAAIRRHAGLLALLALSGVAVFQTLVYLGLRTTTAINGVLINSSGPLFMLLCSWLLEGEHATRRQIGGMLLSLAGIAVIVSQGELGRLLELEFRAGDAWILLAMPIWGLYSVLLKRRPPELDGLDLLFVISVMGFAMLAPLFALDALLAPLRWPTLSEAAGIVYFGLAASAAAFFCWNRGIATVGANAAGFTLPLLPAFGSVLAMIFLGEAFQAYHAAGIATIVAGIILASRAAPGAR